MIASHLIVSTLILMTIVYVGYGRINLQSHIEGEKKKYANFTRTQPPKKNGFEKDLNLNSSNDLKTNKEDYDKFKIKLKWIGYWLRSHKFTSFDERFNTKKRSVMTPYYHQKFPEPRLRRMNESLALICRSGVTNCVEEIFDAYTLTPEANIFRADPNKYDFDYKNYTETLSLRYASSSRRTLRAIKHEPFSNKLKLWQFRVTASYFMCFFTLQKLNVLDSFGENCKRISGKVMFTSAGRLYYQYSRTDPTPDFRSDDTVPFQCALYSFCPDICCGKIDGVIKKKRDCQDSWLNPCRNIADRSCTLFSDFRAISFDYMTANRINYSCNCNKSLPGTIWSADYIQCVDLDECEDEKRCTLNGEACQNTLGSYSCTCRWGYRRKGRICINDTTLGYAADIQKKVKPKGKDDPFNFDSQDTVVDVKKQKNIPASLRAVWAFNRFTARIAKTVMSIFKRAEKNEFDDEMED